MSQLDLTQLVEKMQGFISDLDYLTSVLVEDLDQHDYPFWLYEGDKNDLTSFLTELGHDNDEEEGPSTTVFPALVGMSAHQLDIVRDINTARLDLAVFLSQFNDQRIDNGVYVVKYLLKQVNLRRFNRKAMARQFFVLNKRPDRIRYYWHDSTTNNKMTAEKAAALYNRLIKKADTNYFKTKLTKEQDKLLALPKDLIVARVYSPQPQPRFNAIAGDERFNGKVGVMPVFFPALTGDPLPELQPLPSTISESNRFSRSDKLIEEEAYAPAARIHLYKT